MKTLETGQIVDSRYRVIEQLGRGGFGSVYCAEHITIKRRVALKLLASQLAQYPEASKRFEREAFATGRLDHPNCVSVSDCGRLKDGVPYIVMELVDGVCLLDEVDDHGAMEPARVLRIARHLLSGIAHAHEQGVVHRDLKPANVMLVERDGDRDFAVILDFGIAKLVGDALAIAGGERLTATGIALGSPRYMSPEQISGDPLDGRSDLYSLSIMLYELLVGETPFDGDGASLLKQHLTGEVVPPSLRAPSAGITPSLDALIVEGLAKAPEDRPSSADEYLRRVEAILAQGVPGHAAKSTEPVATAETVAFSTEAERSAVGDLATPLAKNGASSLSTVAWVGAALMAVVGVAIAAAIPSENGPTTPVAGPPPFASGEEAGGLPSGTGGDVEGELALPSAPELATGSGTAVAEAVAGMRGASDVASLSEIEELLREGKFGAAKKRLERERKAHGEDLYLRYLLGQAYFGQMWWADGFEEYGAVVAAQPAMRADPRIIEDVISSLQSPRKWWRGRDFLVRKIGQPALPHLLRAADASKSPKQRDRIRQVLHSLARKSR